MLARGRQTWRAAAQQVVMRPSVATDSKHVRNRALAVLNPAAAGPLSWVNLPSAGVEIFLINNIDNYFATLFYFLWRPEPGVSCSENRRSAIRQKIGLAYRSYQ